MAFNERIPPTRTALLELKQQRETAASGLEILKDKEDALVSEFISILKKTRNLRKRLSEDIIKGKAELSCAEGWLGAARTSHIALSCVPQQNMALDKKSVMGTTLPKIQSKNIKRNVLERGYSLKDSSESVDNAAGFFESALETVLCVGEVEASALILGKEITKTRAKTNSLEKIILPEIMFDAKKIRNALDEIERQEIGKLKRIKKHRQNVIP